MIGVSADNQSAADRFRESLELPFPLVGDPAVVKAWGVAIPLLGMARRVTFAVGRDGRITHRYESNLAAGSHASEACAFVRRPEGRD